LVCGLGLPAVVAGAAVGDGEFVTLGGHGCREEDRGKTGAPSRNRREPRGTRPHPGPLPEGEGGRGKEDAEA
jgi:hypothetical protein